MVIELSLSKEKNTFALVTLKRNVALLAIIKPNQTSNFKLSLKYLYSLLSYE